MFAVVAYTEKTKKHGLPKKKIVTREIKGDGFSYLYINVFGKKEKYKKQRLLHLLKKYKGRTILCNNFPDSIDKVFLADTNAYRTRLTFNAFSRYVKALPRKELTIGIYDVGGEYLSLLEKVTAHAKTVLVMTENLDAFQTEFDRLSEIYGTAPSLTNNLSELEKCRVVFWNDYSRGVGQTVFGIVNLSANSSMLSLPKCVRMTIPADLDAIDFMAEIYKETGNRSLLEIEPIYVKDGEFFVHIAQNLS